MSQEQDFKSLFLDEADEQIAKLNKELLILEKDKGDVELVNEIFRAAHTLKGSAALEGYNDMSDLLHEMEGVLEKIKNRKIELNEKVIDMLFTCLDGLQEIVGSVKQKKKTKIDILSLVKELRELSKGITGPKSQLRPLERQEVELTSSEKEKILQGFKEGLSFFEIRADFEKDDTIRSTKAYLIYNNCLEMGEVIRTMPAMKDVESGQIAIEQFEIFMLSSRSSEEIKRIIDPGDIKAINLSQISKEDFLQRTSKQIRADMERNSKSNGSQFRSAVRVDINSLNELTNNAEELAINTNKLFQITLDFKSANIARNLVEHLEEVASHLGKLSQSLLKISLSLRRQSLELIFQRFERLVRDLSKQQGKEIIFKASGSQIMLDKDVIDKIGEALLHMIRNSVDHAIEFPTERLKAGKPRTGEIILTVSTQDNHLVLQISDDGRGFDIALIKKIAIERHFIKTNEAKKIDNNEVIDLIFQPGFSTKTDVTETSGRGIGMDVVLDVVKKIGGQLNYQYEQGKGVKFIIRIPLSVCQKGKGLV